MESNKTNSWYRLSSSQVLDKLNTDPESGLSKQEAENRFEKYGPNQLQTSKKINPLALFFGQFKDVLIIILLIAAGVSLGLGIIEEGGEGAQEALLIFIIVIAIAIVGFFNEYKAEKTVEALKKLVGFDANVRRGSKTIKVSAVNLVPGDIVLIEAGQKLPADIRLLESNEIKSDESSLTGESLAVSKNINDIKDEVSLGDQKNMLFSGTHITDGSGLGVVVETGQTTELGKIAEMVEGVEAEPTPMQQKLDKLGKKLGMVITAICVAVFIAVFFLVPESREAGLLTRLVFAFTAAVALAVAAIPEGLAFVVRISLALGARRMAKKNALVRKLSAVEALGSTNVICSDKTGTLTRGEMTVRKIFTSGQMGTLTGSGYKSNGEIEFDKKKPESLDLILKLGVLCNNASIDEDKVVGDPTEACLLVSAGKGGHEVAKITKENKRLYEIPFNSDRKMMTTIHKNTDGGFIIAEKGALESTLDKCSHYLDENGKKQKMSSKFEEDIHKINQELASDALRVLAFAYKTTESKPEKAEAEKNLTFVGLQAMMDPPRKEVAEVIEKVQSDAGLRVIMITGDYIETAKAIAKEIGITGDAISGVDLDKLSDKEFEEKVKTTNTYARVNPEHKIKIVEVLQKQGNQVAMTGDGVNDAPAIKAADIGIAMGITGTDVTKEAADLILLDDQFLTIVNAIEEGRGIFDNVRKFVNFLISCNIAEVIAILGGILIFNDLLLTAVQILFINIVTDGLPAVALGSDPAQSNILKQKPKRFQQNILNKRVWYEIFIFGFLMSSFLIAHFMYNQQNISRAAAVSAVFTAMVVYELVRLIDIRTDYKIKWFSNPWLSVALVSSFLLQLSILYVPFLANYFEVQPLAAHDWIIMIVVSAILIFTMKALNPILDHFIEGSETGQA